MVKFTYSYFCRKEFLKVGQVAPLGAMTDAQGATSSKGVIGEAMSSKGTTGGP